MGNHRADVYGVRPTCRVWRKQSNNESLFFGPVRLLVFIANLHRYEDAQKELEAV
jgi:hypothetical protein